MLSGRRLSITFLCVIPLMAVAEDVNTNGESSRTSRVTAGAVVEITAPLPVAPLVTVTNPKTPHQPVPAHDGAEYLKTVPGFAMIRKGGTDGDPVLRGMAGSRLNILLDGEQILGGCGMRMDPPTAYVFPESYDSVTVVKGPETVLYGPGNSAGTVLFERGAARLAATGVSGSSSLMGGSFGRNDEVLDVKGGTPDFYVRGIGTRSHSGDYEAGKGQAIHSKYTRWSTNAALGWTPTEQTRLELTATQSNGEAAYADRTMDGVQFLRENAGLKFEMGRLSAVVEQLSLQAFHNYIDHVMDNYSLRSFVASPSAPEPMANNPDRTTNGGRAAVALNLFEATRLTVGADLQTNVHTKRASMKQWSLPEENKPRVEDARFRNVGVFGELTQPLSEQDQLIAGLRADRWHAEDPRAQVALTAMVNAANPTFQATRDETLTSGFLRFEHELAPSGMTLYAGLGHSERFPDYWEVIAKESLNSVSAFKTKPEKTTQLDVGLVQQAGALKTSWSLFYSKVSDFILIQSNVAKVAPVRLATVTRNVEATTWGGELAVAAVLSPAVKLDASLAYTRGENITDALSLGQIPPLEARMGLQYDRQWWSLGGLVRAVARQARFALNQGNIVGQDLGPTGGFTVFSVNAGWKPVQGLQLSTGVDNVFSRDYAEHISRNASQVPGYAVQAIRVNEPGRTLWLKASYKWD